MNTIAKNATVAGASMGLANPQSIILTQSFQQGITDANKYADNLTLLASASGGGTDATGMLNQAIKDSVAQLIPAASGSKVLTSELFALAQRGGGPAAGSLKDLAKWADNTQNPMQDLQGKTDALTRSAQNLTRDVQNLSTALGTQLSGAMAAAIFQANGGQPVFDKFATAVLQTGKDSGTTQLAAQQLAISLYNQLGHNVGLTQNEFESFARYGLGLTKQQADTLWQQTLPALQRSINNLHGKDIPITATLSGVGQVVITGTGTASIVGAGNIRLHSAAGGLVTMGTTSTADDVLAGVSKGETIVSAADSKKLAPAFAALGIKGYSLGGLIGSLGAAPPGIENFVGADVSKIAQIDIQKVVSADMAKAKAAMATVGPASAGGHINWSPGANVNQWASTVQQAERMLGLPTGPLGDDVLFLYQMLTESGGNPFAVNRTDSNWLAGHPSVGLMQVIAGTYAAYGAPKFGYPGPVAYGVSENPLANIYAAGNYAMHNRGIGTGPGQLGSGHGYDSGGWLPPGISLAVNNTGRHERVLPPGGSSQAIEIHLSWDMSKIPPGIDPRTLEAIRYTVRTKGGGSVQSAFGKPGC